jgi:hypothetical protein
MKMECFDSQMPQRAASVTSEPAQAIVIPPRYLPRAHAISIGSQKRFKLTKREEIYHETMPKSQRNAKESDYQKLDTKQLASQARQRYESLSRHPQQNKLKETAENQQHASSTGQESHYEPLRLKSVNKESEYQELKIIRT